MRNSLPASHLSDAERLAELGRILATGVIRMKAGKSSPLSADGRESSVDFTPPKSGHACRNSGGMTP